MRLVLLRILRMKGGSKPGGKRKRVVRPLLQKINEKFQADELNIICLKK